MQLSEHFSLEEMTITSVRGIDNTPTALVKATLVETARAMEEVRALLGKPIHINSAYRSLAVNKAVGSKTTKSQHIEGKAVDFICPQFGSPRQIVEKIKKSSLRYDQLILEFDSWVHISFTKDKNRSQVLVIDNIGTRIFV
jgi:very-short-patch-repair endonuclease